MKSLLFFEWWGVNESATSSALLASGFVGSRFLLFFSLLRKFRDNPQNGCGFIELYIFDLLFVFFPRRLNSPTARPKPVHLDIGYISHSNRLKPTELENDAGLSLFYEEKKG